MCLLDIFILSCFIGYFAIWSVTPVLHSPLMSVTNAISGIVIIGAFQALNNIHAQNEAYLLYAAIFFASVNIFGGFYVSARMLNMFKPKDKQDD
ncbi:MAG: NAD(P) transhydrogenase subunit alpha [Alphaproteobacteria bacterium]|nr:NAD(P) transhydrogenase subunit alpha [Alphaproteobacteria bacterium]MBO5285193.1 NAD(P) transhydrogenase subunit alpha [Alphaproteobacteria bacterium]MBO5441455.1 NAD(P) transhydrogenase subunit alpha [Alphaproteobacteria bacterium]MBP3687333.1 NAD(P) transhydrogenase subunit alpha [Alphaproteobacteria bacterium]